MDYSIVVLAIAVLRAPHKGSQGSHRFCPCPLSGRSPLGRKKITSPHLFRAELDITGWSRLADRSGGHEAEEQRGAPEMIDVVLSARGEKTRPGPELASSIGDGAEYSGVTQRKKKKKLGPAEISVKHGPTHPMT